MLIRCNRTVVAANRMARETGARVGGLCWRDFGPTEYIFEENKRFIHEYPGCIPPAGVKCTPLVWWMRRSQDWGMAAC